MTASTSSHGRRLTRVIVPLRFAVLAAGLAALLTACDSSHPASPRATVAVPSPTSAPTTAATAAPTTQTAKPGVTSPSASTGTGAVPATTAPSASRVLPCPTRALGTKKGGSQGAAGSTYTTIDFTNISGVTCTLYGYPGVSLAGGTPVHQIGAAASHNPSPTKTLVTLAPGQASHLLLQIAHAANYPSAQCDPMNTTYLQIYPPNQTTPIYFSYTSLGCAKPIHLLTGSAVQAGA